MRYGTGIDWQAHHAEQTRLIQESIRKSQERALYEAVYSPSQNQVSDGSASGSGGGGIPETSGGYVPPNPETGETLYYIRIFAQNNDLMFMGFFYVNDSSHIVQRFYNLDEPTLDIRSTGGNGGPTYLYYPGWLCFDGGGCNVTKFPYLYGETLGDYNLYGNPSFSNGSVDGEESVIYEFSLTPFNS